MSSDDFARVVLSPRNGLGELSFHEFIKVFVYGDWNTLFDLLSPQVLADSTLPNPSLDKFLPDPVKTEMFQLVFRRFPYVTAIPIVFSAVLLGVSLTKLAIPFINRIANNIEKSGLNSGKKASSVSVTGPGFDFSIGRTKRALEENAANSSYPFQENLVHSHRKDWVNATLGSLHTGGKVGPLLRRIVNVWSSLIVPMGVNVGIYTGCHIRFLYWNTHCKPFGYSLNLFNLFGQSLIVFLNELLEPVPFGIE